MEIFEKNLPELVPVSAHHFASLDRKTLSGLKVDRIEIKFNRLGYKICWTETDNVGYKLYPSSGRL